MGRFPKSSCIPTNAVEQEPCTASISENIYIAGKRADRFEFTWPTGNKTIVMRDGDNVSVNGKPAFLVPDDKYTFCAVNTESEKGFALNIRAQARTRTSISADPQPQHCWTAGCPAPRGASDHDERFLDGEQRTFAILRTGTRCATPILLIWQGRR